MAKADRDAAPARAARKRRTLKPIRPSAVDRDKYQAQLDRLIGEMSSSLTYWLRAQWNKNTPHLALSGLGADASPARDLQKLLRLRGRVWRQKFNALAPKLAEHYGRKTQERIDGNLAKMLRDHGFTVKFRMTRSLNDVMQANIAEQVNLITSIPDQYLKDVEGAVMRSVSAGRDLSVLSDDLQNIVGITKRRAATIARDQNNKATATLTRARHIELGITQAEWMHSGGGKKPRPSHVKASGKLYDVDKGMYLDGVWTWPGVEINCRCVALAVLPDLGDDE